MTEDKMVGWHHGFDGHEFEQAPGDGERQGSWACCSPWGHSCVSFISTYILSAQNRDINQTLTWSKTGSKQEKEYVKAVYHHPAYLTSMPSTS